MAQEPPLHVSDVQITQQTLRANLTNVSGKPISGYAVVLEYVDKKGQSLGREVRSAAYDPGALERPALPPGHTTPLGDVSIPPEVGGTPKLSVDYVLFADRSSWGPDAEKQSLFIEGILYGAHMTRSRLKRVLKDTGPDAVMNELK
jgi:hypothetical protein